MRLDITGRHVTVTPALRQLITKRLATLERVLNDSAISALVIVTKEKYRHKVEMAIHTRGDHTLSGNAEDTSWPLAMRQTAKVVRNRKVTPEADESTPISTAPRVIKATRYAVKAMSVDDAALLLDAGDDDFLVFRDAADDDAVTVMYRRKDGNLGLIQP